MSSRWKFWLITGVTLLAVLATLALGRWQLSRAAQKVALQASIDAKAALPAIEGRALVAKADPTSELHRTVTLRGRWMGDRTVFLDNRPMNDKVGFYVVTPLVLEGGAGVILVQRGWAGRNFVDRASIPKIDTHAGVVEVRGRVAPPPGKLYELGGPESGLIRQNLDVARFSVELGVPLLTVSVQQTGVATEGLLREWSPASTGADRNYGYAFQWFGLSSLFAILYVWFQVVRRFISSRRA